MKRGGSVPVTLKGSFATSGYRTYFGDAYHAVYSVLPNHIYEEHLLSLTEDDRYRIYKTHRARFMILANADELEILSR